MIDFFINSFLTKNYTLFKLIQLNIKTNKKMKKIILTCSIAFSSILINQKAVAQSLIDIGFGASTQDNYFTNISYRHQVSNNFRIGIEAQVSSPKYRFINAKLFTKGYATSIHIPLTFKITEQEKIRLDGYVRPGVRFQGVLDPDKNDKRDSILNSTAIMFDAGLLVNIKLTEKLNLNSGVSFPTGFQIAPSTLFEYFGAANFHGGLSYAASTKTILFAKGMTGPALGANGDTYKYFWSLQAGIRLSLGNKQKGNPLLLEPSF
jgi:hypothetical protein